MEQPILDGIGPALRHGIQYDACDHLSIIRMNHAVIGSDATGEEVGGWIAAEVLDRIAEELHCPVGIAGTAIDRPWKVGHQRAEPCFTRGERVLAPLALGDVAYERTVVFLPFVRQKIDTHLDGNQPAILGLMARLNHHGPALPGFFPKSRPHVRLKLGIQIVDGHSAQLVFRIPQHSAGCLVHIQHLSLWIDPVHGVSGPVY